MDYLKQGAKQPCSVFFGIWKIKSKDEYTQPLTKKNKKKKHFGQQPESWVKNIKNQVWPLFFFAITRGESLAHLKFVTFKAIVIKRYAHNWYASWFMSSHIKKKRNWINAHPWIFVTIHQRGRRLSLRIVSLCNVTSRWATQKRFYKCFTWLTVLT